MIKIEFIKDFRCFKTGEVLRLPGPACLLVGDQGSGKSSLLHVLMNAEREKIAQVECLGDAPLSFRYFDTEKMNPRIQTEIMPNSQFLFQVGCRFASHGETMLPILMTKDLLESKNRLSLLVDEPEAGLSLASQVKLRNHYRAMLERGHHLIISTHSSILMKLMDSVYEVVERKLIPTDEYLKRFID